MKLLFEKDCKKTQPDPFMFEADGKYYMYVTAGRGVEAYTADTIVISEDTTFGEVQLPDGQYAMLFEMYDATGASALSDVVLFDCANGEIMTTVF